MKRIVECPHCGRHKPASPAIKGEITLRCGCGEVTEFAMAGAVSTVMVIECDD